MVTPSDLIFGLASLRDCCYCILSFLLLPAHSFIPTSNVVFDSWCLEAMRCGADAFERLALISCSNIGSISLVNGIIKVQLVSPPCYLITGLEVQMVVCCD